MRIMLSGVLAIAVLAGCGSEETGDDPLANVGAGGGAASGGTGSGTGLGGGPNPFPTGVTIRLEKLAEPGDVLSFGLPLPPGAVLDARDVRVAVGGEAIAAVVEPTLFEHDADGAPKGVRAIVVQVPADRLTGDELEVEIAWSGEGPEPTTGRTPYEALSFDSPDIAPVAERTIEKVSGKATLIETKTEDRTLFVGREPRVLATYPPGYLASTGILGPQVTEAQAAAPAWAGLAFLSKAARDFSLSAMHAETYRLDAWQSPSDAYAGAVVDPVENYEGWLYDRCATFLGVYAHTNDVRFLRHALRSCSYYASKIELSGPNRGIWTGKPEPDDKYSHLRGLYAYWAITADEAALAAGEAIAEHWLEDELFVKPYREGHLRGYDKLWTERLLGTSLEGLYYGHRLTGDPDYLQAVREMVATAHLHVTGDAAALAQINAGYDFPPQDCFIHSGLQHADGDEDDPWCSGWMSELVVDPLVAYQRQTGDERVDEIFVRLARALRDLGSAYFRSDPYDDFFLDPEVCWDPSHGESVRRLVPLYGAGLLPNGTRANFGEYTDFEHCTDASALVAAAIRALVRRGEYDQGGPIGPFATEGKSFLQLHTELAECARLSFAFWTRPRRDPAVWTSEELEDGLGDPASFIRDNKIGWPIHPSQPLRKLSWWLNVSMLQWGLLADAGIEIPVLTPGAIQPPGCD